MALNARNRVPAIDVLQVDYEYCSISFYVEGSRNDLGEPSRTLTQESTNIRCSIDAMARIPTYVRQSGLRELLRQGIIERSVFIITLSANQTIEPGYVVTDYDDTMYDVLHVINWHTHKEGFLRKMS